MVTYAERYTYAASLDARASAYAVAATAPGLRADAARYLAGEADRLDSEAGLNRRYADSHLIADSLDPEVGLQPEPAEANPIGPTGMAGRASRRPRRPTGRPPTGT